MQLVVVSCLIFHVIIQMFFPVSIFNVVSLIVFNSSTELLSFSIFFQLSLPFIFVCRLSEHRPNTSGYSFLALLVSALFSLEYALMSSLCMYFYTLSAPESKAFFFSSVSLLSQIKIILISSLLSYFIVTYPEIIRIDFSYIYALYPVEYLKQAPSNYGNFPLKGVIGVLTCPSCHIPPCYWLLLCR